MLSIADRSVLNSEAFQWISSSNLYRVKIPEPDNTGEIFN